MVTQFLDKKKHNNKHHFCDVIGNDIEEVKTALKEAHAKNVEGFKYVPNKRRGEFDCAWLKDALHLKTIAIGHCEIKNAHLMYELPLTMIGLDGCKLDLPLDLSQFSLLRFLGLSWREGQYVNMGEALSLTRLTLSGFDSRKASVLAVNSPTFEQLWLKHSKLIDFQKLDMPTLDRLITDYTSGLMSLDGIDNLKSLEVLRLPATEIQKFDQLGNLSNLVGLGIKAKKGIRSLDFLERLPNLTNLVISGTILDEDLSPLLQLKKLTDIRMPFKKTYSHTKKEILDYIARR